MSCDRSVVVLGDKHSYLSSDKSLSRDSAFLWAKVKIYLSSKSKDPCYMTIARFFMRCAIFQCFWLFAAVCNLGKKLATFKPYSVLVYELFAYARVAILRTQLGAKAKKMQDQRDIPKGSKPFVFIVQILIQEEGECFNSKSTLPPY